MRKLVAGFLLLGVNIGVAQAPRTVYIVELEMAPVASFVGDSTRGLKATTPGETGDTRLNARSKAVRDYVQVIDAEHAEMLVAASEVVGRALSPVQEYHYALNGFAFRLTADEAARLAELPGIRRVEAERFEYPQTDAGPAWIGADQVWQGANGSPATRGEGVVVGIIDGGINASHPAFAAIDGDGYVHVNPEGRRFGLCQTSQLLSCNNKLIGIYDMTDEAPRNGNDTEGHGSHVAGIAVGNVRTASIAASTTTLQLRVSGAAPRANLITYKACLKATATTTSVCPSSATTAALDRAIADGVDVINYSIGGGAIEPWSTLSGGGGSASMRAMANAARAGIAISVSAGNEGPLSESVTSPSNSPWVIAAANATHNRKLANTLTDLSGANSAPPMASFIGDGLTGGVGPVRLLLGEQRGAALCSQGSNLDSPPTGISNPWTGLVFNGEIVVCDRGTQARVAKSFNVRLAGGGGMVLVNAAADGDSTVSDDHSLPATHIGFNAGQQLKAWIRANADGAQGRLTGVQALREDRFGDVLAASSSRGPDVSGARMLKPNLTGPGSSILSAAATGAGEATLSGTSMASPLIAGALALLRAGRPNESFGTLFSALELTAIAAVRRQDSTTAANLLEAGMGRTRVDRALASGLVLPLSISDFDRESPLSGGDPARLNTASLYREECTTRCSFTRTVKAWRAGTYAVADTSVGGVSIAATPASFSLAVGQTQAINFEVDVSHPRVLGRWAFGELTITSSSDPSIPAAVFRSAMRSAAGNIPNFGRNYSVNQDRGYIDDTLDGLVALTALSFVVQGPELARDFTSALVVDPTPNEAFDNENGTVTHSVELTSVGEVRAEVVSSTARNLDLFLGADRNGNGLAEENELLCESVSMQSIESCRVFDQPAGRYWIRLQNRSALNASDASVVAIATIPTQVLNRRAHATGPGNAAAGAPIPFRLAYDVSGLKNAERAYATLELRAGASPETTFARIPLSFLRTGVGLPQAFYLQSDQAASFQLPPGGAHERLVIDVPIGATRLDVAMRGVEGNASLYLAKSPIESIGVLPVSPPESAASVSANGPDSNEMVSLSAPSLSPGRWYVVARNPGAASIGVEITARITSSVAAPFAFETWYNPERSGHGLFFTRAADTAQMVWYSYDDTAQPTWYLGFPDGLTSSAGQAGTDLYRYSWVGGAAHATRVGRATFSRQAERMVFDWEIDGQSGSEAMTLLTNSACVTGPTGAFDPSGLWFEPARSGYGVNIFVRPDTDFAVMYLYDSQGRPRWLLGQNGSFGQAPLELFQYTGFCASCAAVPVTRRSVGSFTRSFDATPVAGAEISGRWTISANFAAPVTGSWIANNVASQLLTGRRACAP